MGASATSETDRGPASETKPQAWVVANTARGPARPTVLAGESKPTVMAGEPLAATYALHKRTGHKHMGLASATEMRHEAWRRQIGVRVVKWALGRGSAILTNAIVIRKREGKHVRCVLLTLVSCSVRLDRLPLQLGFACDIDTSPAIPAWPPVVPP